MTFLLDHFGWLVVCGLLLHHVVFPAWGGPRAMTRTASRDASPQGAASRAVHSLGAAEVEPCSAGAPLASQAAGFSPRPKKIGKPCAANGKRKYRTEADALIAFSNHPRMMRVYLCPTCGFWHGSRKYKEHTA